MNGNRAFLWLWVLLLTAGCAPVKLHAPEFAGAPPVRHAGLAITLLPAVDARTYPAADLPLLRRQEAIIVIPAETIADLGRREMLAQGLFSEIRHYEGPLPDRAAFKWSDFPLRGLTTDLALGLEIKRLDLRQTSKSPYMVPRALLDAALLPLFALGSLASDAHVDLGGWLVPVSQVEYTIALELNVLSLQGDGLIFSKTYQAQLVDPAVSDRALSEGFFWSTNEGQRLGQTVAPELAETLFRRICRDPELVFLPRYAEAAWLGRIMKDERTGPREKAGILMALAARLEPPVENGRARSAQAEADPVRRAAATSRDRLRVQIGRILLDELGTLKRRQMDAALSEDEAALDTAASGLLGRLAGEPAVNRDLRQRLAAADTDLYKKKTIASLLARALETLDNEDFLEKQMAEWTGVLKSGSAEVRTEAAVLLLAVRGPEAAEAVNLDDEALLPLLSAEDTWAKPRVEQRLEKENLTPQVIRLAGAFRLDPAVPLLLAAFEQAGQEGGGRPQTGSPADPVLVVRALGCFDRKPEVRRAFRAFLAQRLTEENLAEDQAELVAEVLQTLGRWRDPESLDSIFACWERSWPDQGQSHRVRRAALAAMADLGSTELFGRVLARAQGLSVDLPEDLAMLRETVDFFGKVDYAPAVPLLERVLTHPRASEVMLTACFQALGNILAPEAEAQLKALSADASWRLSHGAAEALEAQARLRALRLARKGTT